MASASPSPLPAIPSVLVIEDELRIASFVSRALSAEGYAVQFAGDGEQGLALALSGRYDLVILDLLLPGLDGTTVLDRLLAELPGQRVLVLSAVGEVEARVRCLERGAVDYLTKPFALNELMARVRLRVREPEAPAPVRFFEVGPVTLDLVRRTADTGEGPRVLSDREFTLLHHLMLKDGDVCSREQLLEAVWRLNFATSGNVVDVYVKRLRAKLGSDVIETVRGAGYRLGMP